MYCTFFFDGQEILSDNKIAVGHLYYLCQELVSTDVKKLLEYIGSNLESVITLELNLFYYKY